MSFYNMINGCNPCTFFILPMLGRHPDEYPRFRDCFTSDEEYTEYDNHIHVYTRVGSLNQGDGFGEEELMKDPLFVGFFDDSFDATYGTYVFKVPEKWKADFDLISEGKIKNVSEEYQLQVRKIYPKLKDEIDKIWPQTKDILNNEQETE